MSALYFAGEIKISLENYALLNNEIELADKCDRNSADSFNLLMRFSVALRLFEMIHIKHRIIRIDVDVSNDFYRMKNLILFCRICILSSDPTYKIYVIVNETYFSEQNHYSAQCKTVCWKKRVSKRDEEAKRKEKRGKKDILGVGGMDIRRGETIVPLWAT